MKNIANILRFPTTGSKSSKVCYKKITVWKNYVLLSLGITAQFILKKKRNTGTDPIINTGTDPMINTRTDNIVNPPNPHPLRDNTSGFLVTFFPQKSNIIIPIIYK